MECVKWTKLGKIKSQRDLIEEQHLGKKLYFSNYGFTNNNMKKIPIVNDENRKSNL